MLSSLVHTHTHFSQIEVYGREITQVWIQIVIRLYTKCNKYILKDTERSQEYSNHSSDQDMAETSSEINCHLAAILSRGNLRRGLIMLKYFR